jgi:hypothetical protein
MDDALAALPLTDLESTIARFREEDPFEARAAFVLHTFTGLQPRMEDANGLQGAVDLALCRDGRVADIAEVTRTLDSRFQQNSHQLTTLLAEVNERYQGERGWVLHLEHGWRLPDARNRERFIVGIVDSLSTLNIQTGFENRIEIAPLVEAYRAIEPSEAAVVLAGWNANVPDAGDDPYLDRLSEYLRGPLVERKVHKLETERVRLAAVGCHLYVGMSSTGLNGGLLPASPSYFTWGSFACPEPISDLWLDAGTGEVYHWDRTTGWTFHRT